MNEASFSKYDFSCVCFKKKVGVDKTTDTENVGIELARQDKKVLLIATDARANLTMALRYNRPDDISVTLSLCV